MIGILTFHYTTNYGAILQTYALQKFLISAGIHSEVIDYRQKSALKTYAKVLFLNKNFLHGFIKYLKFKKFIKENIIVSNLKAYDKKNLNEIISKYETIIVGSDEVWKTNSFRGYDPSFFLIFDKYQIKKISFAASVGGIKTFGNKKNTINNALKDFKFISVRDDLSRRLIKKESGQDCIKIFDPTLLIEFPIDTKIKIKIKDYILVYGKLKKDEIKIVREIAILNNYEIISIGYNNIDVDQNFLSAGVKEWIEYFRHAKIIFSSFFHGVIFGLKFHKNTFVLKRNEKDYKIDELKDDLKLIVKKSFQGIDFSHTSIHHYVYSDSSEKLIYKARQLAFEFIDKAV